ncbi:hypothetical protein EXIGLDRAFT_720052 [Exidia glandulosa HHB12029]|uniref:Uncharacterized protein n=1 Tax=Exidia glandulosa HHB12029 TaxID=1314781 RepID=A0A165NNM9_EXIGL|nr:hypothetical protein EXIGLDRAFT_720052 [Exidia glandulosa HHB12029]
MAVVSRRQPSALVSTGLSVATVALNVAGAATDSVPIAKQILNSAAHISAFAEKMHKKQEAMHMLIKKAENYSTQIHIAVAGRVLDAQLQQRLARLLSVFVKIEALVEEKLGRKKNPARLWHKFITKPNRAEELAAELDQAMTLFTVRPSSHLVSLTVDDTARAVAEDARYDGQFRRLRDCDIEKLDVIDTRETDEGVVVWASARVEGQLMIIRYLESQPHAKTEIVGTFHGIPLYRPKYALDVYIEHIKKVSTVCGSHPHIAQLYGRHVQGPGAVFKAGTVTLHGYLKTLRAVDGNTDDIAVKQLRLDASAHLADVHGLKWNGINAMVDENGEPRIGLFDDIVRADPYRSPNAVPISFMVSASYVWPEPWTHYSLPRTSEETGVVEQVHDSSLHAIIKEQLRDGNDTDRLQRVWDIIRREQLYVWSYKSTFPITANLSLTQRLIARARLYFETCPGKEEMLSFQFIRHVVIGRGANISPRVRINITPGQVNSEFGIEVEASSHDDTHIHYHRFCIDISAGCPLLAAVARAAGLPDDFEHSQNRLRMNIYPETRNRGRFDESHADSGSEEYDENYETADEGDASFDAVEE